VHALRDTHHSQTLPPMYEMRIFTILLTLSILGILTSCDCVQNVTGTVIDEQTDHSIQDAHVQIENKKYDQAYTDEDGKFEIRSISSGLFGCPPLSIIVNKEGYVSKKVEIDNSEHGTIKLQGIE